MNTALRWTFLGLGTITAYVMLGRLMLAYAAPTGHAAAFFPPAGIALAVIFSAGVRAWPFVAAGSFLLNVGPLFFKTSSLPAAQMLVYSSVIATGATLQALLGSFLITRAMGGEGSLRTERDVALFLFLGGPVACVLNALIGPLGLVVADVLEWKAFFEKVLAWWIGDALGVLVFAPLSLLFLGKPRRVWRQRLLPVGAPLVLATLLVLWTFADASSREQANVNKAFQERAANDRQAFERRLESSLQSLHTLSTLAQVADTPLNPQRFRVLADGALKVSYAPDLVAWIPQHMANGATVGAVFPESWVAITGSPLSNDEAFLAVLKNSLEQGHPAVAKLDALPLELRERPVLLFLLPNPQGLFLAAIRFETLLSDARHKDELLSPRGELRLQGSESVVFRWGLEKNSPDHAATEHLENRGSIRVGDFTFDVRVSSDPSLILVSGDTHWRILVLGSLFSGMLGGALLVLTGARARAEDLAKEFEVITECVPQLVWASRPDGSVYFVNGRWLEYTGLTLDDMRKGATHLHPDEKEDVLARSLAARNENTTLDLLARLRRFDGVFRWHKIVSYPIFLDNGRDVRRFGTCTDVHDEVLRIHELEAARNLLELAYEVAGVATWEFEVATQKLMRSPGHDKLYGFDELLPLWNIETILERVHPDDRPSVEARIKASRTPGADADGYVMDYRIILPSGETRWIHFVARFVRNDVGVITHHRGAIVDVTGVRRAQERLTAAEIQGQAAQESSRLKSQFVAMVSHELRTPLSGIIGLSDVLLESSLDDFQASLAQNLKRSGESLLHIINDILDMSKIEAGKLEFESITFALGDVIEDVSSLARLAASQKNVSFRVESSCSPHLCLYGDPLRLRQILMNLLSNAVKFTQEGEVVFTISQTQRDDTTLLLHVSVTDSGMGMSEETLRTLFQPFSQADSSTTRRFGGTGLGLSISKSLAESMGGTLRVSSQLGQGSSFCAELPFRVDTAPATASQPALPKSEQAPAPRPIQPTSARILVAEDVEVNRMVLDLMLKSLGLEPTFVLNGREALEALETHPFDLVLMDCHMPEMDGYEATRKVRNHPSLSPDLKSIPIVAMTANVLSGDKEKCLEAGMNDYLSKPVRKEILAETLKRWIPSLHTSP